MKKETIIVPKGIRYISEWKELENYLPKDTPYIMNKTITGCGYTEYCITNNKPVIICSPRKILLENKADQHSSEENVLYLKDEYATFQSFDEDISKNKLTKLSQSDIPNDKALEYTNYLKQKMSDHIMMCAVKLKKPAKFLITYDSFRRIREYLGDTIDLYQIVVDEFQAVFTDARFKSDTENTFLFNLKGLKNLVYLSATPMMDKYLEELDEFKNLPYYELDWYTEDSGRVIRPALQTKQSRSIVEDAKRIINTYKEGKFKKIVRTKEDGTFEEIYSKEAVIYVNSIKNITDIINYCGLNLDTTNILCSDTLDNEKRIRKAFEKGGNPISVGIKCIGTVPKEGEPHKMFTLCTRTVYLGADFYSTCARSFILSDANIDCLSVDITLDLPQILGRQRLDCNPWKNSAELYYRLNTKKKSKEDFEKYLENKIKETESLLNAYNTANKSDKHALAKTYRDLALFKKYKDNFVAVNEKMGSDLKPVFNKLVMIAEMRAFEIQQIDYANRFSVFNALSNQSIISKDISSYISEFFKLGTVERYKYLCNLPNDIALSILPQLPTNFSNYYIVLGPDKMKSLSYNVTLMKREYEGIIGNQNIDIGEYIIKEFEVGKIYPKSIIKKKLKEIYEKLGYKETPRAIDLGNYFYIKDCMITNKETGKRDNCYEIISLKRKY